MKIILRRTVLSLLTTVAFVVSMCTGVMFGSSTDETDDTDPMLHFDASPENSKGEMLHGSTGFLYGVSEVNVPSANLIQAISPKYLIQKVADGQQHPTGDSYRLTSYLQECGVENIQVYLQDYYLEWPYEYNGIDDYDEKVKEVVTKMVSGKTDEEIERYSFVIFNEPDQIWYSNSKDNISRMCTDWLQIYNTIKEINPKIKVTGPALAEFRKTTYKLFLEFCKENDCLPEYFVWHELQKTSLRKVSNHCNSVRELIETYYADSDIEPVMLVNETVNKSDIGNPGGLVNWISVFEEENVYACLPYWGLANSLNELAADANKPNGAWWVYKWYNQMTGNKMPLTLENIYTPSAYGSLYGLSSEDEDAGIIYSLFGGQAGTQTISIENIRSTKTFKNATNAYVKIYSTKFTGQQGFADEIPVEFEGNIAFSGNDLTFTISDAELTDAYFAVIMPSTSNINTSIENYNKTWEQTYEAEDATLIGNAEVYTQTNDSTLARSNRAEVGNLYSESDGVEFSVDVPSNGRYRLNIYYSNQAPQVDPLTLEYVSSDGQNRAIGSLVTHSLTIDGNNEQNIVYDSTVKYGYYNYKTVYVNLTKGSHKIRLMYKGEDQSLKESDSMLCAMLDKIDLTYEQNKEAVVTIEPEELVGSQDGYKLSRNGIYNGAGSAVGSGAFDFYVNVPREGYYNFGVTGNGKATLSQSRVNYAEDAKAESELSISWQDLFDVYLGDTSAGLIYLTAGMNHLRLTGNSITIDQIIFTEFSEYTAENSITVEAEDCQLTGTAADDDYNYLLGSKAVPEVIETEYASGSKAVEGFRGGQYNSLALVVDVSQSGDYKLSISYSNNEPAPVMITQSGDYYVHPYNTDLVERYMQITVNDGTPQTVYFKNTFCWDTYKSVVVDVTLQAGTNVITFTNDNSYKFSSVQDDFTPRLDSFTVARAAIGTSTAVTTTIATTTTTTTTTSAKKTTAKSTASKARTKTTRSAKQVAKDKKAAKKAMKQAKITKLKVKSKAKKKITVSWKKVKKAKGYQVQVSKNKKFKKKKIIYDKLTAKKKLVIKGKKIKRKKTYYVRVRAYATYKDKYGKAKKVYSKWNKKLRKVKVK